MKLIGIVLIVLGVAVLGFGGFTYTTTRSASSISDR